MNPSETSLQVQKQAQKFKKGARIKEEVTDGKPSAPGLKYSELTLDPHPNQLISAKNQAKVNRLPPIDPKNLEGIFEKDSTTQKEVPIHEEPLQAHRSPVIVPSNQEANFVERSQLSNTLLMIGLVLSNYYFGYYLVIANVLAPSLTEHIFEVNQEDIDKTTGRFGFFFAIGCIISSLFSGYLVKVIGRVKLVLLLELLKIVSCLLYRIESLEVFLAVRTLSGVLGGIGLGLVPLVCKELLPQRIQGFGGTSAFLMVSIFMIIGSLQNPLFGGEEGLRQHWKLVLSWPLLVSIVVILILSFTILGA